jgi:hypothetical protein
MVGGVKACVPWVEVGAVPHLSQRHDGRQSAPLARRQAAAVLAGGHTVFCITSVVGCGGGTVRRFDDGSVATALNPSRSNIATVPP